VQRKPEEVEAESPDKVWVCEPVLTTAPVVEPVVATLPLPVVEVAAGFPVLIRPVVILANFPVVIFPVLTGLLAPVVIGLAAPVVMGLAPVVIGFTVPVEVVFVFPEEEPEAPEDCECTKAPT